jgi:hypothetical protein
MYITDEETPSVSGLQQAFTNLQKKTCEYKICKTGSMNNIGLRIFVVMGNCQPGGLFSLII